MKKTLLVTTDFPPMVGGVATYLFDLCRHLPPDRLVVLAPQVAGSEPFDGAQQFRIHRVPLWPLKPSWTGFVPATLGILRQDSEIEVILLGYYCLLSFMLSIALQKRLALIHFVYGTDLIRAQRALLTLGSRAVRWTLKSAHSVVCISNYIRSEVIKLGVPADSTAIIRPPVDSVRFHAGAPPRDVVSPLGVAGRKVVLSVGRLIPSKGFDHVIEAMPAVLQNLPDSVYLVVGAGPDRPRLEALAKQLHVHQSVMFCGFVAENTLPDYYRMCDVFVLPSRVDRAAGRIEGFGIVYSEANACGKPVVAGNSGGTSDAVIDGETGILVDPENLEQIADAVVRLLTDLELAKRMGEEGRRRTVEEVGCAAAADRLREIIGE